MPTESLTSSQLFANATLGTGAGLALWKFLFEAIGMSPAVLLMAGIGAAAGLLFQPPGGGRGRLFVLVCVFTVVAASAITVMQELTLLAWIKSVAAPAALLMAFFSQTLIPPLGDALAARLKRTLGGTSP